MTIIRGYEFRGEPERKIRRRMSCFGATYNINREWPWEECFLANAAHFASPLCKPQVQTNGSCEFPLSGQRWFGRKTQTVFALELFPHLMMKGAP